MSEGRYIFVPLDMATSPVEGHAYVNKWWLVHPEKGVAFWCKPFGYDRSENPAPQCNPNEYVARHLNRRKDEGYEVVFIPVVFATHARRAMRADKDLLKREKLAS